TPCDLATVADYTHLTALMAPRPTLLTYNSKDDCCFESGYALPPLLDAARPFFKLYGKESSLRSHVNDDPGTHNFGKDNRQALYRMFGDHFFDNKKDYDWHEILSDKEVKTKDELAVELPKGNAQSKTGSLLRGDDGRSALQAHAARLIQAGHRVVVIDPLSFGEAKFDTHGYLFSLLLATVGERSLGIQASQVMSAADWAR